MFHHLDLTTVIATDRRRDFTRAADEHRRARPAPFPMRLGRPNLVAPVATTTGHTTVTHTAVTHTAVTHTTVTQPAATQPAEARSATARPAA